jgi:hypothetical protein
MILYCIMADPECVNSQNMFNQRRKMQLLNIPPTRFTPLSPYPQFTQFQLNMRRKVEILKYSASNSNTKTNNFTKSERWAQLVSGNYQRRTIPTSDIAKSSQTNNVIDCSANNLIPIPTSSSGVPGPVVYLYEDPRVPLYNYNVIKSYSILDSNNDEKWNTNTSNNAVFKSGNENLLTLLGIRSYIDKATYTFTTKTSTGIYVAGIVNSGQRPASITFSISNVICNIYYNDIVILSPTVNYSGLNNLTLNIQNSQLGEFNAKLYIGEISIDNFMLETNVYAVYDIKLTFTVSYTNSNASFTITNLGAYCNLSQNNLNNANNCVITGTLSSLQNIGFNLTGI